MNHHKFDDALGHNEEGLNASLDKFSSDHPEDQGEHEDDLDELENIDLDDDDEDGHEDHDEDDDEDEVEDYEVEDM